MKKHYLLNAIIGMGFGFPITLICMVMIGGYNEVLKEFIIWMVSSALYGLLSSAVFNRQSDLPLWGSIGIHAAGCLTITMVAALLCGYITSFFDVLPVLIPAIIIYLLVYGICVLMMKQNEKQVNKALEKNESNNSFQ